MDVRSRIVQPLAARFSARALPTPVANEIELEMSATDLARAATMAVAESGHPLALWSLGAGGDPALARRILLALDFEGEDLLLILNAKLNPGERSYPSLAAALPWAIAPERELRDLHDLDPVGHPDPRSGLQLRPEVPGAGRSKSRSTEAPVGSEWTPTVVEGEGVHRLTLGPPGAPLGEAVELHLGILGERIIHCEPRLGGKHRQAERRAEGLSLLAGSVLAERLCGRCSATHAIAFALAAERMSGTVAPRRAAWTRTAFMEVERLWSHAGALGELLAAVGLDTLAAAAEAAREQLHSAAERATGSRHLRGIVIPGGLRRDLQDEEARLFARSVRQIAGALGTALDTALATPAFVARLEETGTLDGEQVGALGLAGPAARASGSRRDVRRDHPSLAYSEIGFWVPLYGSGDAHARFRLLADEAHQAAAIAEETLANLPEGPSRVVLPESPAGSRGVAIVEGPRGAVLHALHLGAAGRIARWHVHAASFTNWPAFGLTLPGANLEDLPLVRASFDFCVACADR